MCPSTKPFANLASVNLHTDGFAEQGGAAALTVARDSTDVTFATVGLRASTAFTVAGIETRARGMLGRRHAFGNTFPSSVNAFGYSSAFSVAGAPIARDSAIAEAGSTSTSPRLQASALPIMANWHPTHRITASRQTLRCGSSRLHARHADHGRLPGPEDGRVSSAAATAFAGPPWLRARMGQPLPVSVRSRAHGRYRSRAAA
ncbi:autotransporter domain-containing protein [Aminobacter sp. SR38]|uniref:autotransporter outer membrane beta-barrel domain-containing protein n=1 Tax=Aminobacter sp. SR38 TaxID=2774562 RepID=UPI00177C2F49|nr:autotransporter domain-containing protein [Aminobacter sp. SR38]